MVGGVQRDKRHFGAVRAVREGLNGVEHRRRVGVRGLSLAPVHFRPLQEVLNGAMLLCIEVGQVNGVVGVEDDLVLQPVDFHDGYGRILRPRVIKEVVGHTGHRSEDFAVVVGEFLAQ